MSEEKCPSPSTVNNYSNCTVNNAQRDVNINENNIFEPQKSCKTCKAALKTEAKKTSALGKLEAFSNLNSNNIVTN